jgi:hypothetical protein
MLKFIDILTKKGCYHSSLEYNKMLIKLNPTIDPEGALLCLDFTALLSRNYTYLIYFIDCFSRLLLFYIINILIY